MPSLKAMENKTLTAECANPECRRTALTCHSHHIVWKSRGGDNGLENGVTVCSGCHLRLIHGHIVTVEPHREGVLWTYSGRSVWVI